jgi:hypothetical protein
MRGVLSIYGADIVLRLSTHPVNLSGNKGRVTDVRGNRERRNIFDILEKKLTRNKKEND